MIAVGEMYDKYKKKLVGLNIRQLSLFAWLCGVRSLPFLGVQRDFDYWTNDIKQKHLLSVFRALDFARTASATPDSFDSSIFSSNASNASKLAAIASNAAHTSLASSIC